MSCHSAITLRGELRSTPFSDPVPERQEGGVPKKISHKVVPSIFGNVKEYCIGGVQAKAGEP